MNKFKYIIFSLLIITAFSSCNNTDNLTAIFTSNGKKLTVIARQGSRGPVPVMDYWDANDKAAIKKSNDLLINPDNYHLTFDGIEDNGKMEGNFSAKAVQSSFSGKWQADGKSGKISLSISQGMNTKESDPLAKAFVKALQHTYKYKGDRHNLYLYFTEGQTKDRFLVLHNRKDESKK